MPIAGSKRSRVRRGLGLAATWLHPIQRCFAGHVSKSALLIWLLPLSLASFCVTAGIGILLFPGAYDWRTCVISRVISPRYNPEGYWVPSIGFAVGALLCLPFAGYVGQRLRLITPRLARWARWSLTLGFLLVWSVVLSQHIDLGPRFRRLHEALAHISTAFTAFGVVCCSLCALRDRLLIFGGRRRLRRSLAVSWASITLLPTLCGVLTGVLLLGRKADHAWAVDASGFLRSTMLWQLAFWEWVGMVLLFVFLFLTALWLPNQVEAPAPAFARASRSPAEPRAEPDSGFPASVRSM